MVHLSASLLASSWQTIVTLICVGAAMGYVVRQIVRACGPAHGSSCGSCGQSPVTGIKQTPLVTLDALTDSARRSPPARDADPAGK